MWKQKQIRLQPKPRGFHLITRVIIEATSELAEFRTGLLHVFVRHTSASLTINENADPNVRQDLEIAINHVAPEDLPFAHTCEGPDDMPAHVKSSLLGSSVSVPIADGQLLLGTWQGIYLCEHRNSATSRELVVTIHGE